MKNKILPFNFFKQLILIGFIYLSIINSAYSQTNTAAAPSLTKDNIETFLDSIITPLMKEQNVPGCGIAIVKDTSILFSKGYGYADLENKKPFDPDKTLFRTASVCKVVVATVLMQLKEKNLIDLNADINKYLKRFKIKNKFGKPITAANLLTHTPGFDDFYIGKSARTEKEAMPLGEFLKKHLPERIVPPGEVFIYSNLGMALAALLVEEITGKDFEQYTIENLFLPLDMNKSSFRVKEKYRDDIYKGYVYLNGEQNEFPFDFINDYPAGQMLTTINEFSNFIIMHLNNGKFEGKKIVDSLFIDEMQSVQFTHHPKLHSAVGYGFFIDEVNGTKLLSHNGGYPGILTRMLIFPELKLAMFIAMNGYNSNFNSIVTDAVMNKFIPNTSPPPLVKYPLIELPFYDKEVDKFVGSYRFTRYSHNEIAKIGLLMGMIGAELPIWKNDEGMLRMYDLNNKARILIQVEPLLFQSIDDDYYIKFRKDENGNITHLFTDGISSLERTSLVYTINFQRIVFTVVTIVFVLISLGGLVRIIIRKLKKSGNKKNNMFKLAEKISNTYLIYLLLFGLAMNVFLNPLEQMVGFPYGMPWYFYLFQLIPLVFIALTVLFVVKFFAEIKNEATLKFSIVFNVLFMIVCFTTIWFMNTWNLIGFKF